MEEKQTSPNKLVYISIILIGSILISQFISENIIFKATVEGKSMEPTLHQDEVVLVYMLGKVKRNSVIVSHEPNATKLIIKRCVAIPGDTIQLKGGLLYVNNKVVQDNWSKGITYAEGSLVSGIKLKENEYYVLGDNRENSKDSRVFGVIKKEDILGVVLFR